MRLPQPASRQSCGAVWRPSGTSNSKLPTHQHGTSRHDGSACARRESFCQPQVAKLTTFRFSAFRLTTPFLTKGLGLLRHIAVPRSNGVSSADVAFSVPNSSLKPCLTLFWGSGFCCLIVFSINTSSGFCLRASCTCNVTCYDPRVCAGPEAFEVENWGILNPFELFRHSDPVSLR